ncbi:MAG: hypothetical protein A2939_03895 [Parcubacteria group bacterium RIFCSPLOWO2_01_FULL_48_18]|nr:MAG: hypothetical protein A2939_03895 [Parcubacteria group bacterium RIFCSPLOWO2_01_FULL_48_18]
MLSIRYRVGGFVFNKRSLLGRSHCPYCRKTLGWYELIPLVSYLIQKGRCRGCKGPLSVQYPVVELISGVVFAEVPSRLKEIIGGLAPTLLEGSAFFEISVLCWLLFSTILILIAVIDFRDRVVPDELNVAIILVGLIYAAALSAAPDIGFTGGSTIGKFALLLGFQKSIIINRLLASFAAIAFFGIIIAGSRGRAMGMGDLKLGGAAGIFLGWPDIALSLALAFILGSLFSLPLLFTRKKTMKDTVPFAPFIVAGMFTLFFFGEELVSGYLKLFGYFN